MNGKKSVPNIWIFVFLLVAASLVWVGYWVVCVKLLYPAPEGVQPTNIVAERGQFGDMFGGVNALFSAFAFSGLIYMIIMQRQELHLQREELLQTRLELERSAEAQEKSHLAFREQITAMRESAELAALDALIRVNERIVSTNSADPLRRNFKQAQEAERKLTELVLQVEKKLKRTDEKQESKTNNI